MTMRWNLLLLGVVVGLALGWAYGTFVQPVRYIDSDPSALAETYKDDWLVMIAAGYRLDGDLERARSRIVALGYFDAAGAVTALAQRSAADSSRLPGTVQLLGELAFALETGSPPVAQASPTVVIPTATIEPPTATVPPVVETPVAETVAAPTVTPVFDYVVVSREEVCSEPGQATLLQVTVLDAAGNPVAGVTLEVTTPTGSDRFVTGLKPEFGPGYGDFEMTPGVPYGLQLSASSQPIADIRVPTCTTESGATFDGGVRVVLARQQ